MAEPCLIFINPLPHFVLGRSEAVSGCRRPLPGRFHPTPASFPPRVLRAGGWSCLPRGLLVGTREGASSLPRRRSPAGTSGRGVAPARLAPSLWPLTSGLGLAARRQAADTRLGSMDTAVILRRLSSFWRRVVLGSPDRGSRHSARLRSWWAGSSRGRHSGGRRRLRHAGLDGQ